MAAVVFNKIILIYHLDMCNCALFFIYRCQKTFNSFRNIFYFYIYFFFWGGDKIRGWGCGHSLLPKKDPLAHFGFNPLEPSLLGITASPTGPPGAEDPIGDIIVDHILTFKGSTQF